ncbi:MAG: hypothetical protein FWE58_03100 [Methanobrevibacter sp.]|nr:hypothetical protein [Methanobrevibacter sp.]
MKLKILPPSLRINNHYLTLDIKSEVKLNKEELVSAIWYACIRLYGETETSAFNLWLMRFYDIDDIIDMHSENDIENIDNIDDIIDMHSENDIGNMDNIDDIIDMHSENDIEDNIGMNSENIKDRYDKNFQNIDDLGYYYFKAILRCQRGYEDKIRGSLAMLYKYNNKKIAIITVGISGTIVSSMENFIN